VQERETVRVAVRDTESLERIAILRASRRSATNEFSPERRYTVTTHLSDRVVEVFDTASLHEVTTILVGKSRVNLAFYPDR